MKESGRGSLCFHQTHKPSRPDLSQFIDYARFNHTVTSVRFGRKLSGMLLSHAS
jgi:hypothetical protein